MTESVTVVVPTKDRASVLPGTLGAILGQVGVDVRVVVVDDGSTDATPALLAAWADDRLTVVRHDTPRRLPSARNAGLQAVTSPWVAFCDDDDLWAPDKLAVQLAAMARTEARWSCTGSILVDEQLRIIDHLRAPASGDVLAALLAGNVVPGGGSSVVVETALVREVGGFDPALHSSEDWDCWVRLAERSPVAAIDRPLVAYRIWTGSMSTDVARMRASRESVFARTAGLAERLAVRRDVAGHERFLAKQLLRAGDHRAAAGIHLRLAVAERQPVHLLRALAAVTFPKAMHRAGNRRAEHGVPVAWRAEVGPWLGRVAADTRAPA